MADDTYDLVVIGAGPGGYVAAIRAAQLGMKTACVEAEYLGGTCLNVGCIPSKALLDSTHRYQQAKSLAAHGVQLGKISVDLPAMMSRKDAVVKHLTGGVGYLFRKHKIDAVMGRARIISAGSVEVESPESTRTMRAKRILIATGSRPVELPGLRFDSARILSSTEALALSEIPKRLIVVGAGYIGLELGSVWNRLGSEVLVIEFLDRALGGMDKEMAAQLQKLLQKQGLSFRFGLKAESAELADGRVKLTWSAGDQRGVEAADQVLVAVGRKPVTDGLGIAELGIATDPKGYLKVNDRFSTSIEGIYAIGDVIGGPMLAHKASREGIAAVEVMAGRGGHVNYRACPAVVFTHPELAQVGLTEEEASARGPIKVGRFPMIASGRARCMGETEGLVKLISDARTDRLLGVHILAPHASDMIAEAVTAIEFAASTEDLARAFHAHPTLPEAIQEAALAADRRAIHT